MRADCAPFHDTDLDRSIRCRLWTHYAHGGRLNSFPMATGHGCAPQSPTSRLHDVRRGANGAKVDQCHRGMLGRQRIHHIPPPPASLETSGRLQRCMSASLGITRECAHSRSLPIERRSWFLRAFFGRYRRRLLPLLQPRPTRTQTGPFPNKSTLVCATSTRRGVLEAFALGGVRMTENSYPGHAPELDYGRIIAVREQTAI